MNIKRLKVLHIVPGMASGGVARMVQEWYENNQNEKIEFEIATVNLRGIFSDNMEKRGVNILYFEPLKKVGIKKYYRVLKHILKSGNYDIVHSHIGLLSFIPHYIAKKNGIKTRIIHAHTNLFHNDKPHKKIFISLLKKINRIYATDFFSCTKEAGQYFFGKKIISSSKHQIIKNGINLKKFSYSSERRKVLRNKFEVSDKVVIGNVGRYSDQKNQSFIIKIFNDLLSFIPNGVLWLIGEGEDYKLLLDLVSKLNLTEKVFFIKPSNEIFDYYQCMDLFIMPSKYEGLGIVAVEAQAMGLPCVVSTMVPKEVEVTDSIKFLDLTRPEKEWVKIINEYSFQRESKTAMVKSNGYDIEDSTNILIEEYLKRFNKNSN